MLRELPYIRCLGHPCTGGMYGDVTRSSPRRCAVCNILSHYTVYYIRKSKNIKYQKWAKVLPRCTVTRTCSIPLRPRPIPFLPEFFEIRIICDEGGRRGRRVYDDRGGRRKTIPDSSKFASRIIIHIVLLFPRPPGALARLAQSSRSCKGVHITKW